MGKLKIVLSAGGKDDICVNDAITCAKEDFIKKCERRLPKGFFGTYLHNGVGLMPRGIFFISLAAVAYFIYAAISEPQWLRDAMKINATLFAINIAFLYGMKQFGESLRNKMEKWNAIESLPELISDIDKERNILIEDILPNERIRLEHIGMICRLKEVKILSHTICGDSVEIKWENPQTHDVESKMFHVELKQNTEVEEDILYCIDGKLKLVQRYDKK